MTQSHLPSSVPPVPQKRTLVSAIAIALGLGLTMAMILCLVLASPSLMWGWVVSPLAVLGVVLGIVGVSKEPSRARPVSAIVLNVAALVLAVVLFMAHQKATATDVGRMWDSARQSREVDLNLLISSSNEARPGKASP
jgi:hypothetical protein